MNDETLTDERFLELANEIDSAIDATSKHLSDWAIKEAEKRDLGMAHDAAVSTSLSMVAELVHKIAFRSIIKATKKRESELARDCN